MTLQIVVPIAALSFERTPVPGPITKVVGAPSGNAPDDVTSLEDRILVAEELRYVLPLPDVAALRVHQHGAEPGANQRWRNVGSGGLGQHRHTHPTGRPESYPLATSGTIESVNVGVDQAWVDCVREPAVFGGPNVVLLTDPIEAR